MWSLVPVHVALVHCNDEGLQEQIKNPHFLRFPSGCLINLEFLREDKNGSSARMKRDKTKNGHIWDKNKDLNSLSDTIPFNKHKPYPRKTCASTSSTFISLWHNGERIHTQFPGKINQALSEESGRRRRGPIVNFKPQDNRPIPLPFSTWIPRLCSKGVGLKLGTPD